MEKNGKGQDFVLKYNQPRRKERGEMEDRRIFARLGVRFPLRFLDLDASREGDAQTEDISAKGIGFVSAEQLQPYTPLEMWLQIPDQGEPLYARGRVVWSKNLEPNRYRTGVNLERADLMGVSRVMRVTK